MAAARAAVARPETARQSQRLPRPIVNGVRPHSRPNSISSVSPCDCRAHRLGLGERKNARRATRRPFAALARAVGTTATTGTERGGLPFSTRLENGNYQNQVGLRTVIAECGAGCAADGLRIWYNTSVERMRKRKIWKSSRHGRSHGRDSSGIRPTAISARRFPLPDAWRSAGDER